MHKYIHPLQQHYSVNQVKSKTKVSSEQFRDMLFDASNIKISKHAKLRMQERNIELSDSKWDTISMKMHEAKMKGVTDALVVLDDAALVVSTKNNTIVTALNKSEANDKIFTNINGTIII